MRPKKQDIVKRLVRVFVVVMVVLSFQTTKFPNQGKKKNSTTPVNFSIGLKGGWWSWNLGDIHSSKEYNERLDAIPGVTARTNDLNGSFFGGLDLTLELKLSESHYLGLSVGLRYFPGDTLEQGSFHSRAVSTRKLDLSAYAIPIELFYKPCVARHLSLKIGGGATFYNAAIDYDSSRNIFGEAYSWSGKLKDSNLGGHVSLGAEYSLTKNLSLSIDAGYGFAKLDNFTGTLVDRDGTGTEMLLTMARYEFGETIIIHPTAEPLPAYSRPAEIDLSGFKFSAGLKYFFK
jgi:hypothetical protein